MAHKKAGGSTSLGRDSISKRLGVKLFAGQHAKAGSILIRQRGQRFMPGTNVAKGKDDTLYAKIDGIVHFSSRKRPNWYGKLIRKRSVSVMPEKK